MPSTLDLERAYLIEQLGLTEAQGAAMSIADLRNQFYSNPPAAAQPPSQRERPTISTVAGRWHGPAGSQSNVSPLAGSVFFVPAVFPAPLTITDVGIKVETLGAGSQIRLGLFEWDPATEVFTRVADFGSIDTTTTGNKSITGLSVAVDTEKDLHWGVGCTGTAPSLAGAAVGVFSPTQVYGSGTNNAGQAGVIGLRASYALGAFTATYNPGAHAYHGYPNISYKFTLA